VFDLIELLAKNPDRVTDRENLLNIIWGYDYQVISARWTSTSPPAEKLEKNRPSRNGS
jgi:DNA-binding response OmpR family regulator